MRLRAKVSFCGKISAGAGQEFNCPDGVAMDLIGAGYAQEVPNESQSDNNKGNSGPNKSGRRLSK